MGRKIHKPEEIVGKLRQVEVLTAQGMPVEEAVCVISGDRGRRRPCRGRANRRLNIEAERTCSASNFSSGSCQKRTLTAC